MEALGGLEGFVVKVKGLLTLAIDRWKNVVSEDTVAVSQGTVLGPELRW